MIFVIAAVVFLGILAFLVHIFIQLNQIEKRAAELSDRMDAHFE